MFWSLAVAVATSAVVLALIAGSESALAELWSWRASKIVPVPAFATDLGVGTVVTEEHLVSRDFLTSMLPNQVVLEADQVIGRTLIAPVFAGEFVRSERIVTSDASGLSVVISPGMRAMTLDLDPLAYVSGSVQPGNRVDVIVTLPVDDRAYETTTVLRGVKAIAVNEWISTTARGEEIRNSQITLEIRPDDSARLQHADYLAAGKVRLSLIGELEGRGDPPPAAVSPPIGEDAQRMTAAEFREVFTPDEIDEMYEQYFREHQPTEPVVEPRLARELEHPPADAEAP